MKNYQEASKNIPTLRGKKLAQARDTKGTEKVIYRGNIWKMDKATGELTGCE